LSPVSLLESVLNAAGLSPIDGGDVLIVNEYSDAESACRSMMAGGGGARAVRHSGAERVRQTILASFAAFRAADGYYRIENRFRFVIAEKSLRR
jgi:hypothetical protein